MRPIPPDLEEILSQPWPRVLVFGQGRPSRVFLVYGRDEFLRACVAAVRDRQDSDFYAEIDTFVAEPEPVPPPPGAAPIYFDFHRRAAERWKVGDRRRQNIDKARAMRDEALAGDGVAAFELLQFYEPIAAHQWASFIPERP